MPYSEYLNNINDDYVSASAWQEPWNESEKKWTTYYYYYYYLIDKKNCYLLIQWCTSRCMTRTHITGAERNNQLIDLLNLKEATDLVNGHFLFDILQSIIRS